MQQITSDPIAWHDIHIPFDKSSVTVQCAGLSAASRLHFAFGKFQLHHTAARHTAADSLQLLHLSVDSICIQTTDTCILWADHSFVGLA